MQDEAPQDGGEPVAPPTQPVPHLAVAGEVVSPGPDGLTTALRLGLGLVGAAVEQVARTVDPATPVTTEPPRAAALVVGAVVEGREAAAAVVDGVRRAAEPVAPLVRLAGRLPGVGALRDATSRRLDEVAARGRDELDESRTTVSRFVGTATERVATSAAVPELVDQMSGQLLPEVLAAVLPVAITALTRDPEVLGGVIDAVLPDAIDRLGADAAALSPIIDAILPTVIDELAEDPAVLVRVVDAVIGPVLDGALPQVLDMLAAKPELIMGMIGPILDPMIDEVLPVALGKLNEDPSTVRDLVRDQSTGMATEMAHLVRARTVSADDVAEGIVRRLTFRKPRVPALPAPEDADVAVPDAILEEGGA